MALLPDGWMKPTRNWRRQPLPPHSVVLDARTEIVRTDAGLAPLEALTGQKPACVFNLIEALDGRCDLAQAALDRLERLGLTFTGADAASYRLSGDKLAAKAALRAAGLPTPDWSLDGSGFAADATVIVKSVSEHASLGIDAGSVVPAAQAAAQITAREARFGGRFFAEVFVEGREFNLSILDGAVLPPAEIVFWGYAEGKPHIVDWEAKWIEDSDAFRSASREFTFPDRDETLLATLKRLTLQAAEVFGLDGYARVDFRVDAAGNPWILEANSNPCLTPDAGFAATAAQAGLSYDTLIERIVRAALRGRQEPARAA